MLLGNQDKESQVLLYYYEFLLKKGFETDIIDYNDQRLTDFTKEMINENLDKSIEKLDIRMDRTIER